MIKPLPPLTSMKMVVYSVHALVLVPPYCKECNGELDAADACALWGGIGLDLSTSSGLPQIEQEVRDLAAATKSLNSTVTVLDLSIGVRKARQWLCWSRGSKVRCRTADSKPSYYFAESGYVHVLIRLYQNRY